MSSLSSLFVADGNCDFHLVLSLMSLRIYFQKIANTQKQI